jgi:hypothetical protein
MSEVLNAVVQLVVTFNSDSDVLALYYNGQFISSESSAKGPFTDTVPIDKALCAYKQASGPAYERSITGSILEVRYYGRDLHLTPKEILLDYQLGPGGWAARRRKTVSYLPPPPQIITVSEVCTATASAVAPSVTLGAATITVSEVCTGTATAVAPTVTVGAATITVSQVCTGTATAVAPSVTMGAVTITVSQVCLATATAVAPDVLQPIGIPGVEYRVAADRLHYNTTEE